MKMRKWKRVGWSPARHWGHVVGKKETWGWIEISLDRELVIRHVPHLGWLLVAFREPMDRLRVIRSWTHWEYRQMRKPTVPTGTQESSAQHLAAVECQVFAKLHPLVRQCAMTKYDDGEPRLPGSLFISTQGSMWRATVTEPSACLKLTMMAGSLDDALAGLCLALEAESIPWEVDTYALSKRPKKKN